MTKVLIYCHGLNSSSNTDKVHRLRELGFETHAWDINVDPRISLPYLEDKIDNLLMDQMHAPIDLIFVGTSLGGWYASYLACMYGARSVIINPAYDPAWILPTLGVDKEIADQYEVLVPSYRDTVAIAEDDELIDFDDLDIRDTVTIYFPTGGHRFNGPEFDQLVNMVL